MKHDGFLIVIFFVLALVIPAAVFIRVYSTAFSGLRSKSPSKKPAVDPGDAANPEPAQNQQPAAKNAE